jgi:hypothetical protein
MNALQATDWYLTDELRFRSAVIDYWQFLYNKLNNYP